MTGIHFSTSTMAMRAQIGNIYDWKGEDANGAQQNQGYYSEGPMSCSRLSAGGSVAGNIYFDGDIKKALYFANMFDKSATQAGCWPSMSLPLRRMGGEVVCPIKS